MLGTILFSIFLSFIFFLMTSDFISFNWLLERKGEEKGRKEKGKRAWKTRKTGWRRKGKNEPFYWRSPSFCSLVAFLFSVQKAVGSMLCWILSYRKKAKIKCSGSEDSQYVSHSFVYTIYRNNSRERTMFLFTSHSCRTQCFVFIKTLFLKK